MARSKTQKKVVINQAYFELIERKAELLDEMTDGSDSFALAPEHFKTMAKLQKDWDKADGGSLKGCEPYVEPKE